jgi:hypothetical protein
MKDTITGMTASVRGILRGETKIRRGIVAALLLATIVGGALLPVNSAQAHLDYCGTGEHYYSDYYRVVYKAERDEGGKHYNNYDHYYRTDVNSEWVYWYNEWKECP